MNETINTFHRVLSLVGVSIFAERNWNSRWWFFLQIFNFIIGLLCFIFTTGFVLTNYSDLLIFIQGACIWTTGVIMTISLGVCLIYRSDFRTFLTEMVFKDAMLEFPLVDYVVLSNHGGILGELRSMVIESQEKLLKYTRILLKSYVASVWLCATLYLCNPIYQMAVREDQSLRLLAFDMWFPWSLNNFKVYIASFIFHWYAGYLCCIAYPGLQSTIILMIGQIIRQLRIITFILLHLNELILEITSVRDMKWQECCTSVFSQCVIHYVKLKRFSNRLNVICRSFYLALILIATLLVCMSSVKIAISNKTSLDTIKYYVHESCFILMVFMFCSLGQQVEDECEALSKAVTEKWYIFNKAHKTNVTIFSIALNPRMPIYIFGTITLSLPTFTWFIKTGMSFFTLVMSVLEEQE